MEPLIQDPMSVAGFLAALVAGIFWLSGRPSLEKLFEYTPPIDVEVDDRTAEDPRAPATK